MLQGRETGQAHPHDGTVHPRLPEEGEGDADAVIQRRVLLPQGPGPEALGLGQADELGAQGLVVARPQLHLGRAEGGHASGGPLTGGDVEIVGVADGVGGGQD